MPRAILTGAPGTGKTTLLGALSERGLQTVEESARSVIAERKQLGLSPRPTPVQFAEEILRRDTLKYSSAHSAKEWVVFDRGAVEAIGALHAVRPLSQGDLEAALAQHRVQRVFLLPLWPAIYTQDSERDQTIEEAARVEALVRAWYARAGYELTVIERGTPAQRAQAVLHALGAA